MTTATDRLTRWLPLAGVAFAVLAMAGNLTIGDFPDIDTPIGKLSFNDLHEVKKDIQVQVVKDKTFRRHSVISDATLLAPPTKVASK